MIDKIINDKNEVRWVKTILKNYRVLSLSDADFFMDMFCEANRSDTAYVSSWYMDGRWTTFVRAVLIHQEGKEDTLNEVG